MSDPYLLHHINDSIQVQYKQQHHHQHQQQQQQQYAIIHPQSDKGDSVWQMLQAPIYDMLRIIFNK